MRLKLIKSCKKKCTRHSKKPFFQLLNNKTSVKVMHNYLLNIAFNTFSVQFHGFF